MVGRAAWTDEEKALLEARAATLEERLAGAPVSTSSGVCVEERLERWQLSLGQEEDGRSDGLLKKRLAWDGRSLDDARRAVADPVGGTGCGTAWADRLEDMLSSIASGAGRAEADLLDRRCPVPFEDLLLGVAAYGRRRLEERAGAALSLLSPRARLWLPRPLLEGIGSLCVLPLEQEFTEFRTAARPLALLLARSGRPTGSTELYQGFVERMREGAIWDFFRRFPVLGRLVVTVAGFWEDRLVELLERLACDLSSLEERFHGGQPLGRVGRLRTGLSDPHANGRSVVILEFDSGRTIVYKPRPVEMEAALNGYLAALSAHEPALDFRTYRVLPRDGYGWAEHVPHRPCRDREALGRFYLRAGHLLAAVYSLRGTDCHADNVVADGEHPVLVDAETLLDGVVREWSAPEDPVKPTYSVTSSAFLPLWSLEPGEGTANNGGLAGAVEEEGSVARWVAVNTDGMSLREGQGAGEGLRANVPYVEGTPGTPRVVGDPQLMSGRIAEGFREAYRAIVRHREALLAGPLVAFRDQPIRILMRSTAVYRRLISKSIEPPLLADGAERGIFLERAGRAFLQSRERPEAWPVHRAEQRSMERLDIPWFGARTGEQGLRWMGHEIVPDLLDTAPYDSLLGHVAAMGETDLDLQAGCVRLAFEVARTVERTGWKPAEAPEGRMTWEDLPPPLDQAALLAEARRIGEELLANAVSSGKELRFLGPKLSDSFFRYGPIGVDLYNGAAGVIMFLAALVRAASSSTFPGDDAPRWRRALLQAAAPLRRGAGEVRAPGLAEGSLQGLGLGGAAIGAASVVYGLALAGSLSGEAGLLDDAVALARDVRPEDVERDQAFDVIGGSAGAILALTAVHDLTGEDCLLDLAARCGRHLLAHRVAGVAGLRTWATPNGKVRSGMAHGAAGIALALSRLHERRPNPEIAAAAAETIAYEREVLLAEAGGRPEAGVTGVTGLQGRSAGRAWCSGAPGVAMARLGCSFSAPGDGIETDLELALDSACRSPLPPSDHLCCGALGLADVLLTAGGRLGRPELKARAAGVAALAVGEAAEEGGYRLFPALPGAVQLPGLFEGISGIGYQLLRLSDPGRFPSVLLLEGVADSIRPPENGQKVSGHEQR